MFLKSEFYESLLKCIDVFNLLPPFSLQGNDSLQFYINLLKQPEGREYNFHYLKFHISREIKGVKTSLSHSSFLPI